MVLTAAMLQSCSSEYEDSMAKTQECLEDKYDDGDGDLKYASIEEALTAYDFEGARSLLSCYEDQDYWPERSIWSQLIGDAYHVVPPSNEYRKRLLKIVTSEITYYMKNGEEDLAKAAAQESNLYLVYNQALPELVNSLITKGEITKALSILSKYTFNTNIPEVNHYKEVEAYNDEANSFNDMVNSLFNYALFEEDKALLKKCLILYVQNTNTKADDAHHHITSVLLRNYDTKNMAQAKLKEFGLRL